MESLAEPPLLQLEEGALGLQLRAVRTRVKSRIAELQVRLLPICADAAIFWRGSHATKWLVVANASAQAEDTYAVSPSTPLLSTHIQDNSFVCGACLGEWEQGWKRNPWFKCWACGQRGVRRGMLHLSACPAYSAHRLEHARTAGCQRPATGQRAATGAGRRWRGTLGGASIRTGTCCWPHRLWAALHVGPERQGTAWAPS